MLLKVARPDHLEAVVAQQPRNDFVNLKQSQITTNADVSATAELEQNRSANFSRKRPHTVIKVTIA